MPLIRYDLDSQLFREFILSQESLVVRKQFILSGAALNLSWNAQRRVVQHDLQLLYQLNFGNEYEEIRFSSVWKHNPRRRDIDLAEHRLALSHTLYTSSNPFTAQARTLFSAEYVTQFQAHQNNANVFRLHDVTYIAPHRQKKSPFAFSSPHKRTAKNIFTEGSPVKRAIQLLTKTKTLVCQEYPETKHMFCGNVIPLASQKPLIRDLLLYIDGRIYAPD